jgi:hypothetical protein
MPSRGCSRDPFLGDVVRSIIKSGEVIADYPDDTPYPSKLILGFYNDTPIHAVVAHDSDPRNCIVVTVYEPDPELWEKDFKRRKTGL